MMRFKQVYAFIVRDLKIVVSDKVALFWMLVWPTIWLILTAYVFIPPGSVSPIKLSVGVVNLDVDFNSFNLTAEKFIDLLSNLTYEGVKIFNVVEYKTVENLVDDLRKGRIDVGIVIPRGFAYNLSTGSAKLRILIGAKDVYSASINYGVIKGFIDEFSKRVGLVKANISINYMEMWFRSMGNLTNNALTNVSVLPSEVLDYAKKYLIGVAIPIDPIYEEIKPEVYETRENMLGWYTVGAVGMVFLYSGFSLGASAMYREREFGSLRRVLAAPITPSTLVVALIISNMVVLIISTPVVIFVGLAVGAKIIFNPFNPVHWLTPILLVTAAYMCIGIGLALSPLAKTSHSASTIGIAIGLLLSFTSGIWFPKTWMPSWLHILSDIFPVTWVINTIRNIMVYGLGLESVWIDMVKIALASIFIVIVDIIVYKLNIRRYIESM